MKNNLTVYQSVITDIKNIINAGQREAYGAASKAMVMTYWHVGKRIVEQEQAGKEHAEYGKKLLAALSDELINMGMDIPNAICDISENFTNISLMKRFGTHAFQI